MVRLANLAIIIEIRVKRIEDRIENRLTVNGRPTEHHKSRDQMARQESHMRRHDFRSGAIQIVDGLQTQKLLVTRCNSYEYKC